MSNNSRLCSICGKMCFGYRCMDCCKNGRNKGRLSQKLLTRKRNYLNYKKYGIITKKELNKLENI